MPAFTCFPVTGKLDAVEAALVEPFSIGVYSVRCAGITDIQHSIAIFGAGPIGLSILLKLLADGFMNIGMIEPLDYRLEKAKNLGARWTINPENVDVLSEVRKWEELLLDVVFDASGEQDAVDNALRILKPGGRLVLVGIPPDAKYSFDMDLMRRKELTVINVRRQNHCVEEAIELIAGGKVKVREMVTHTFRLEETPAAFKMVAGYHDHVIKAMICM
jgi:L-iditol 2-dehydrogenase